MPAAIKKPEVTFVACECERRQQPLESLWRHLLLCEGVVQPVTSGVLGSLYSYVRALYKVPVAVGEPVVASRSAAV